MNSVTASQGRQREALRMAFGHLGYEADCIRPDWRLGAPANRHDAHLRTLDLAIFHDPREHDYTTIAAAVELGQQDLVQDKTRGKERAKQLFEQTIAPHVVLGGTTTTDLWLDCHEDPVPIKDVPISAEALIGALEQHRNKLERAALVRLRGGQGSLFDRLYQARREELAGALNLGFSQALASDPRLWQDDEPRALLSAAAIAILAARILEDKGFLAPPGPLPPPHADARRLLGAVEAKADGFFTKVLADLNTVTKRLGAAKVDAALRPIMAHLTGPVCFSLVTPEMLGHLYEGALIPERATSKRTMAADPTRRGSPKAQWIHYTPLTLSKHILRRLPVEEIPQDQRRVLDMACGSGTFLLAATDRLSTLYDAREEPFHPAEPSRFAYLRSRVVGHDIDEVALLVTKLSYLVAHWARSGSMKDIPEPTCGRQDALSLATESFGEKRPTVVVGNPPFESATVQLANRFLTKAIELLAPGGLLGMVLPLGFLKMKREGCPEMRRHLFDACDLLEVWEQPLGAVGLQARQETCVILARRRGGALGQPTATLFKQTYSGADAAVRALKEHLRSTRTFVSSGLPGRPGAPWSLDRYARIIASPLDAVWQKINLSRTLGGICEGHTGIDMVGAPKSAFSSKSSDHVVPYMRHQSQLRPYGVVRADWYMDPRLPESKYNYVDPSKARKPRKKYWPLYAGAKVLVTMRGNRNNRHQVVAAYAPTFAKKGIFPEDDLGCIGIWQVHDRLESWARPLVREQTPRAILLWVAAILNSHLAQAWIAMRGAARGLSIDDFTSLPMPRYESAIVELTEQIVALGRTEGIPMRRACWELYNANLPTEISNEFEVLVGCLNHRIAASYGLNDDDVHALDCYLREMTDPWVDAREDAHLARPGVYRRIAGTVVAVDVARQEMTLDLPRYRQDSPVVVPLPRDIPGWTLIAGVEFTCSVPAESLSVDDLRDPWLLRDFMPIPYPYFTTDELERMIGYERPREPVDGE